MRIEIHEYITQKPDGDRARKLDPCSCFEVVLITDKGTTKTLKEFDQFDAWNCHIKAHDKVWPKARKYANEMADTLECDGPMHRRFVEKKVERVDWVEQQSGGRA